MSSKFGPQGRGADATGRSKSQDAHHVRLYDWFMNTDAWRVLTPAERCVYIEIERRYFGKGSNNGRIAFGVRQAQRACNISKTTASKALHRLQELGFVECATPGGFTRKTPHATEWRLTRERCDVTGQSATKAFMRWREAAQ